MKDKIIQKMLADCLKIAEKRQISRRQLAKLANISERTMYGTGIPKFETVYKIATGLGVGVEVKLIE